MSIPQRWRILAWVLVVLSFLVRLRNLDAPLLERHEFRQTQTAITVYWFLQEGIHPIDYPTPTLGPPWRLPMEFPTWQIAAALVARTGLLSLDASCRLTNILFFYLSALALFAVCRRLFAAPATSWCIVLSYLWIPYTLVWSRTAMIDYASVAFGLGYLHFFLRWLDGDRRVWVVGLTLAVGVLAYLTKVTTMTMIVPILGGLIVYHAVKAWSAAGKAQFMRLGTLAVVGLLILAPVACELAWLRHSDQVKAASPATDFYPVRHWGAWNYFTWEQIRDANNWKVIGERISTQFLPGLLPLFPLTALGAVFLESRRAAVFFFLCLFAFGATIFVHFNLYVIHDYYLMGVSPLPAIGLGLGAYHLLGGVAIPRWWPRVALVLTCAASLATSPVREYLKPSYGRDARRIADAPENRPHAELSRALNRLCPVDEYTVVCDNHLSPRVLYYARRKGLMIWERREFFKPGMRELIKNNRFTFVAFAHPFPELMNLWKYQHLVEIADPFRVYRVSDTEAESPLPLRLRLGGSKGMRGCQPLRDVEFTPDAARLHVTGPLPALLLPAVDAHDCAGLLLTMRLRAPEKSLTALYYLLEGMPGYDDHHVRIADLEPGMNVIQWRIPAEKLFGQMRLDPGRVKGEFVLEDLEIRAIPQPCATTAR